MATVIEITPTRFVVPASGFDSLKRYLRKKIGGPISVNSGRTWNIDSYSAQTENQYEVDSYGPWLAFKFSNGVSSASFLYVRAGSLHDIRTVDDPVHNIVACDIE